MQLTPYILLIVLLSCGANQNDEKHILQSIILYSQHSQLLDSCNINNHSYTDLDNFAQQNRDQIYNAFLQTVEICTALELESPLCFEDCIYYVSPLTLLLNTTTYNQTYKILNWYQMGGGPIGWYETGDPDMCSYTGGTYCFTPIPMLQEHGCCVPGTCVGEDAVKVLQENVWCYQGYNQTYAQYMFHGNVTITNRCEPLPRDFSSSGCSIVIIIFFIFVLCVFIASFKTQFLTEKLSEDAENVAVYDANWFLYCFSIQNTWRIFNFRRPENKSEFNFLDGIRFVSILWVIWGHVWMDAFKYYDYPLSNGLTILPPLPGSMLPQAGNVDDYPYVFNQLSMMFVEYGYYAVDSFYYISGFLGAFSIYRRLKTYDINKAVGTMHIWIPLAYLHRILRLLPMMAFIIFVEFFILDQLPYGYKVVSRDKHYWFCADSWYKVLLFYDNFAPNSGACMPHLWYVQTDMQMFLLLPWIMLLYKWKALVGIFASLIPFFVCISIRLFFAIYYHLSANRVLPAHEAINGYGDSVHDLYYKPWGRMAPYFFGTFTMFIILTFKKYKYKIQSRATYFCVMGLSCFIMLCLIFWPWEDVKNAPRERWSLVSNQIYYALSRPAWGVALGLLTFALVFKYNYFKSVIGAILALEIYQPFAKLTYTMYLIHSMVSIWFWNSLNSPVYYELWWLLAVFMVVAAVTMGLTIMLWFIIEQPMANIVGLCMKHVFFRKSKSKKIIDTELISIKQDKLLIERDTSQHSYLKNDTSGKGVSGGDYESFVDAANDPHDLSIKSNYDTF